MSNLCPDAFVTATTYLLLPAPSLVTAFAIAPTQPLQNPFPASHSLGTRDYGAIVELARLESFSHRCRADRTVFGHATGACGGQGRSCCSVHCCCGIGPGISGSDPTGSAGLLRLTVSSVSIGHDPRNQSR